MQEAEPRARPLQNHLPEVTHLMTEDGAWMPQYLQQAMMIDYEPDILVQPLNQHITICKEKARVGSWKCFAAKAFRACSDAS